MTKFLTLVAAFALTAAPAFAQSGATQSPPAPNSSSSGPQSGNSVPSGGLTMNPSAPQNPNSSGGVTTNTATGQQVQPMTPGTTPAAPSGSTGPTGSPSDAFAKTVPTPAK